MQTTTLVSDEPVSEAWGQIRTLLRAGRSREGVDLARQAPRSHPGDSLIESLLLFVDVTRSRARATQERLVEIIRAHPTLLYPRIAEAGLRFGLGSPREAIADLERLLGMADAKWRVHLALLELKLRAGRDQEAWEHAVAAAALEAPLTVQDRRNMYLSGRAAGERARAWRLASSGMGSLERLKLWLWPSMTLQLAIDTVALMLGLGFNSLALVGIAGVVAIGEWWQLRPCARRCRFLLLSEPVWGVVALWLLRDIETSAVRIWSGIAGGAVAVAVIVVAARRQQVRD